MAKTRRNLLDELNPDEFVPQKPFIGPNGQREVKPEPVDDSRPEEAASQPTGESSSAANAGHAPVSPGEQNQTQPAEAEPNPVQQSPRAGDQQTASVAQGQDKPSGKGSATGTSQRAAAAVTVTVDPRKAKREQLKTLIMKGGQEIQFPNSFPHIRLEPELYDRVKRLALESGVPAANIVHSILMQWLSRNEKSIDDILK